MIQGMDFPPPFPNNCAIRERTGDGVNVGRCYFNLEDNDICPRHGDVHSLMEEFRKTGNLQEDPRYRRGE